MSNIYEVQKDNCSLFRMADGDFGHGAGSRGVEQGEG